MDRHNLVKQTAKTAISEDCIKQIKMLAGNSEKASTHSLSSYKTLNESINSISIGSNTIPSIVDKIQLLLVKSQLLSFNALTSSTEARKSDSELSTISEDLNSLSIEIQKNLDLVLDASKNIIAHSTQCTDIVEDTTEKIEITELSAQFVSHFVSSIELNSVTKLLTAKTN